MVNISTQKTAGESDFVKGIYSYSLIIQYKFYVIMLIYCI